MALGNTLEVAKGADVTWAVHQLQIRGRSTQFGEDNFNTAGGVGGQIGEFRSTVEGSTHMFWIWEFPLDLDKYGGHDLSMWRYYLPFVQASWTSGYPHSGALELYVYELLKNVNRSGVDFRRWDTTIVDGSTDWAEYGAKPGVDHASTPVATIVLPESIKAGTLPFNTLFAELKAVLDRKAKLGATKAQFIVKYNWHKGTNENAWFRVDPPRSVPNSPHGYHKVVHTPRLAFKRVDASGRVDHNGFLNPYAVERSEHLDTGSPSPGGAGPTRRAALTNSGDSEVTRVAALGPEAFSETPTRETGLILRHGHVFRETVDEGLQGDCSFRIVAGDTSAQYKVYRTPRFGTEDPTPLSTEALNAYGRYAETDRFIYNGKVALEIRPEWWITSPIPADEEVVIDALAERRPVGYAREAIERHQLAPSEVGNRAAADDTRWVSLLHCTYQQLAAATFVASYTTAEEGTIDRSFLPVGHAEGHFFPGDPAIVFDDTNLETFVVRAVLAPNHATPSWRDCVVPDHELAHTYGTDAIVLVGVYAASLKARDRSLVLSARAGDPYFTVQTPLVAANGVVQLYSTTDPTKVETHSFTASAGTVTLAGGAILLNTYAQGDEVFVVEDLSWVDVHARLVAPDDADPAEMLALVRSQRVQRK
jgi:hypothetical protein